jgi:GMP synthase-like glutamine amidotransferase
MADARLLVIDNAMDHGTYRPVEHWAEMVGYSPESVYPPGGEALPDPDRYSHVIVTGSEDSINNLPSGAREEAGWLKEAMDAGAALLGSCWGHQLIAVVLAGQGAVRRAATPEFGWIEIPVADGGGLLPSGTIQTFSSHFDEVIAGCHPELRVLASSPHCAVQAARWGDRPVWGLQPHPEMSPEHAKELLAAGARTWPGSAERFHAALAGPVLDSGAGKILVRRFLELPGG